MQSPVHMEQQLHSMRKPVGARQVGQFALYSLPPFSVNFRSRSSKVQPLFLTIFKTLQLLLWEDEPLCECTVGGGNGWHLRAYSLTARQTACCWGAAASHDKDLPPVFSQCFTDVGGSRQIAWPMASGFEPRKITLDSLEVAPTRL